MTSTSVSLLRKADGEGEEHAGRPTYARGYELNDSMKRTERQKSLAIASLHQT